MPFTSFDDDAADIRVRIDPDAANGLKKPSFAMCDKLTAVSVSNLGEKIGTASAADMKSIRDAIFALLDEPG